MEEMSFPARIEHIRKVDNLVAGWEEVKLAIRPEFREDRSIEKAKVALTAGLNDAAINYFWNLVIFDLGKKILAYGIEYFASAINWDGKPLKSITDLREVPDYLLINGAHALGIIGNESQYFIQQCRDIRNNFSTAHYPLGDLDNLETFNFIKNCIKYVLSFDLPAPGLQIKDLIERFIEEKYDDIEEIRVIIESQSSKIHGPILHNLFSNFIRPDCEANLKHNIRLLSPYLWEIVDEEVKSSIGSKFASLRDIKGKDAANEALEFLKTVNGVSYIPETFKEIIFKKHSQALIDAHFEWNNFYNEPSHSRELFSLGKDVPISAIHTYVKAITVSFIGNTYGIAGGAQEFNINMISELSQTGVRFLFKILKSDKDVIRELSNGNPINRLKDLMDLIKEKTMLPEQKTDFDFFVKADVSKLKHHFYNLYINLLKK